MIAALQRALYAYSHPVRRRLWSIDGWTALRDRLLWLLPRTARIQLACGVTLHGDLRDNRFGWRQLANTGFLEPEVERFLAEFLRPGDVFLDVGANTGMMTAVGAHCVGPTGRVVSFEPDQALAACVEISARLNGLTNVLIHRRAVASRPGSIEMVRQTGVGGTDYSRMIAVAEAEDRPTHESRALVDCITIDEVTRNLPRCDLIKIDVDGNERDVIASARETIDRWHPAIIVEVSPLSSRHGYRGADLVRELQQDGYTTAVIVRRTPASLEGMHLVESPGPGVEGNVLAWVPAAHEARVPRLADPEAWLHGLMEDCRRQRMPDRIQADARASS